MTDAEIAELRAGLEGVTPGPWYTVRGGSSVFIRNAAGRIAATDRKPYFESYDEEDAATAAFIAAAREAVPMLIAEVERLRAENERTANNRDMWKGQCERQADSLMKLRVSGIALLEAARLVSAYGAQTGSQWVKLSAAIPQMSAALSIAKAGG